MVSVIFSGFLTACGNSGTSSKTESQKTSIDPNVVYNVIDSPFDRSGENGNSISSEMTEGSEMVDDAQISDPSQASDTAKNSGSVDALTDTIPSAEDIASGNIRFNSITEAGDRYYVLYSVYGDETDQYSLCSFDADGKNVLNIPLPVAKNGWVVGMGADPDGGFVLVQSLYEEETQTGSIELLYFSIADDEAQAAENGPQISEKWKQVLEEETLNSNCVVCNGQYTVLISEKAAHIFANEDGKNLHTVDLPSGDFYGGICLNEKNEFVLAGAGADDTNAWRLDPAAGTFTKAEIASEGFYDFSNISNGNGGYDFFLSRDDGIYGFVLDGTEPVKVVDFIASDLDIESVMYFAVISPDSALTVFYRQNGEANIYLLNKADPSTVVDKTLITIGCSYMNSGLRKAVVDFNKTNEKYRFVVREYGYDEEGSGGLNKELAAGNIPDLICVTPDMPVQSYAAKGMFEDIESRFESDSEIPQNDYFANVLDLHRIDGKMYFVVPEFNLIGMLGKRKDFADAKGVKIADLEKMMKERNLGYDTVIGIVSSEQVLTMVMYFATDKYVDWENMTCSFDSDSFVSVLEFAGRFPAKINYSNVDWDDYETWLLEGKQLVREGFFYNIDSYMEQRYGYVGEEISFMGYLGDGENGPVVETDMLLAMSHASEYKDVCWEFMRSFYLDQYQGNIDFGFPVSKKAYRTMAEKAMQPKTYTYTDENGEEITQEYNNELYINGKSVTIPIAQQKDIDEVTRMIENTDSRAMIDQNISNIINEESGAFFAGQKSAEETARIIQNRVSVYIGEIR